MEEEIGDDEIPTLGRFPIGGPGEHGPGPRRLPLTRPEARVRPLARVVALRRRARAQDDVAHADAVGQPAQELGPAPDLFRAAVAVVDHDLPQGADPGRRVDVSPALVRIVTALIAHLHQTRRRSAAATQR